MARKIMHFFDKLEDKTRSTLSRSPLLYALLGSIGIILFWRGIWHLADDINMSSLISAIAGGFILLLTGVFVSAFVGNRLIISGLSGEKKLTEKTKEEIETEEAQLRKLQTTIERVEKEVIKIESELENK